MSGNGDAVLGQFSFEVAGTHYEDRQAIIRVLSPGDPLSLWRLPVEGKDPNGLGIILEKGRKKIQVGWVPWVLNSLLLKMSLVSVEVRSTGTDSDGAWTLITVLVSYIPSEASKLLEDHGARVAGVLDRMLYKSISFARQIASLPTEDIKLAIEVYDEEGARETKEKRRSPKRKKEVDDQL